jgi:hypothetical protein
VPLVQNATRIVVGSGEDLGDPLAAALDALLSRGGKPLQVEVPMRVTCRYRRRLVTPLDGTPRRSAACTRSSTSRRSRWVTTVWRRFADRAATQAASWLAAQEMDVAAEDEWLVDVAVYASGDRELARPLVELSGLTVPIGDGDGPRPQG